MKIYDEVYDRIKTKVKQKQLLKKSWYYASLNCLEVLGLIYLTNLILYMNYLYVASIIFGITLSRSGFVMHMAGHNSLVPKYNNTFFYIYKNLICGVSSKWWRDRHNKHHQNTNVKTKDPDLKTQPLLVYNEKLWISTITQHQRLLMPFYLSIYVLIWRISSLIKCFKKGWNFDLFMTSIHWILKINMLYYHDFDNYDLIKFCLISDAITGLYLGFVFMLNHFTEDLIDYENDYNLLEHTLKTTRNIHEGPFLTWFSGGLNYQIEHHLFTSCPIENLPEVRKIVKTECQKESIEYRESSFFGAIGIVWNKLKKIEKIAYENHSTILQILAFSTVYFWS